MTFQDVENARKVYHEKVKKGWLAVLVITLTTGFLSIVSYSYASRSPFMIMVGIFFIIFAIAIGGIIIHLTTNQDAKAYRHAYKAYFVEQNLKNTFTKLTYSHDNGINKGILIASGMINTGDVFHANDLVTGKYKDVTFLQSDAHILVEQTDSEGHTSYVTIFKGRFMIFEFPKKFNFKLELIGKNFRAYRIPGKNSKTGRKMTKLNTESTEFNRSFKIMSEDGFESFYILDPAMIDKIQTIADRYKNNLLLGFIDNMLLVAINDGKDAFEPPKASKPIDEKAEASKINNDTKVITDFVDELSLNHWQTPLFYAIIVTCALVC